MNISEIESFYLIVKENGFNTKICRMTDRCDNCIMNRLAFNEIVTLRNVYCGHFQKNEEAVLNKLKGIIRKEKLAKLLS